MNIYKIVLHNINTIYFFIFDYIQRTMRRFQIHLGISLIHSSTPSQPHSHTFSAKTHKFISYQITTELRKKLQPF